MAEKWTDTDMRKFLDIYQNYEVLWNPKLELYSNNQARKSALQAIIQHMNKTNLTEYELKNKIKNIRTTYNRELTKVRKSRKSGTGTEDIYVPTLVWFKQAHNFLRVVTEARSSKSNLNIPSQSQSQDVDDGEDAISNISSQNVEGAEVEPPCSTINANKTEGSINPHTIQSPKVRQIKGKAKELQTSGTLINEALCKLEDIAKGNKMEDEFETFGKHIANQLRRLPLHRALQIQQDFQSILTRERIESLNMRPPSVQGSYCSSSNIWSSHTSPLSPGGSNQESTYRQSILYNNQGDILTEALNSINDLDNC